MTTGLYLLRVIQGGIALGDLELLSMGMVRDIFTEAENDTLEWDEIATEEDVEAL